jgi:putative peptide zinc metalloprotease protein
MPHDRASPLPSADRPYPMRARADLVVRAAGYQGRQCWLVKDVVSLEYHRLYPAQYRVLTLLNGARSLEQIRAELLREFPTERLTVPELQTLIADFHAQGLVLSDRPGQGNVLLTRGRETRGRRWRQALANALYIRLPGWDPERTLARLEPLAGWMFRPWGVCLCLALIAAAGALFFIEAGDLEREFSVASQFFGWPNLFWLWLTLGLAKILHEFGHGLACRRMGGECHEIGMAFLVFSPCLYCDVSDSWMLPEKWRRIAVAAAGMYVELVISAVALLVWSCTQPGLLHFLALQAFLVTTFTTIMLNANPLLQFDGYFILSDLLEIPNLRAKADRLCAQAAARTCLGIEFPAEPFVPESGRPWFVAYAAASAVYRFCLLFSIGFVLHEFLKPYGLHPFSALLVGAMVVRMILNGFRLISGPRMRPMKPMRTAGTFLTAAALVAAALWLPIPMRTELPFLVQPLGGRHVYATASGRLARVFVEPGQQVEAGDLLVELENFPEDDRLAGLKTARRTQQVELEIQRRLNDAAGMRIAGELLARLDEQIADYERQIGQRRIVAPCRGTVIAPPAVRRPLRDAAARQPEPRWYGTPLAARNLGAWIETGTHLLSVAPSDRFEAVIVIEQQQRNDVSQGQAVELKCESRPDTAWEGTLATIGDRHVETVPIALSSKFGGPMPTVTGPDGRERLISSAFEGVIRLPDAAVTVLPDMQGRARFTSHERTAAQWLWRYLKANFQFTL